MTGEFIPLVDLGWQQEAVADEVAAGFERVLKSAGFVGGPDVAAFEQEFAAFSGAAHGVGVANGTDAIELIVRAAGIGVGDEVLVPANTFVATAEAVVRAGATPVFVDCDPHTYLIDPERVHAALGPRTRAVVPVHLYGQLAPVAELAAATAGTSVELFADGAQAQGATAEGAPGHVVGVAGHVRAAATSFYPGKNLGAHGDAGAVLTDDAELARRVRRIGNHGSERKYAHDEFGVNSRLDALQAVVPRAKLARLAEWNESRRAAAARYDSMLSALPEVVRPVTSPGNVHVWHLYVVRVPHRDEVVRRLNAAGIGAGIHYPVPVHRQPAFAGFDLGPGGCPVADRTAAEILSLPLFPGIRGQQQERVVAALDEALR